MLSITRRGETCWVVALVSLGLTLSAFGQGTPEDYDRAERFQKATQNKVFRRTVIPRWSADGNHFWYRVDVANGEHEFISVDAVRGIRKAAFDHERLAQALSKLGHGPISAKKLPIEQLEFTAKAFRLTAFGQRFECEPGSYVIREKAPDKKESSLAPLRDIRPTQRTGPAANITFVNRRSEQLSLFWVDSDGRRRGYGVVGAGKEVTLGSYAGHVWLLVDKEKRPIAVFEANEGVNRAVIEEGMKPLSVEPPVRQPNGALSPDKKWRVVFQDHNVVLREQSSGKDFAVSKEGTEADGYGGDVYWSPDSSRFVVKRSTKVETRKVSLIESSPKDQTQPKLHQVAYAKPGDPLPVSKPHLFDVAGRKEIPVSDALFSNPWSVDLLQWDRDGKEFSFLYNQRGHQALRLIGIDGQTGKTRAIIDETSKTFVDYNGKFFIREIEETGEIIWMSERDGWNHLYLMDRRSGTVKNAITHGNWVVRGVERVDVKSRQIWFRAGGIYVDQDPYYMHHCRVNFDGSNLVKLTAGDGTHTIAYSPDARFLIDSYSRVDLPPFTELRSAETGKLVCALEQGDMSALVRSGWKVPERFVAKGRDDSTDIFGVFYRPTNFDSGKKYPVIEAIYAGPHGSFVPKEFREFYRPQEMAELGFIVVQIDGMGTSHRSKAFHDVCWKNLGDSGFADRIRWIKAAARKDPSMDLSRGVGIYGGSAGGQSTLRGLLAHGDFYRVGVADCGCHDNRMDKVWWNELWMGYPVGPHYDAQSNVTNAHKLSGKLMLTVGELDRNVDPASTMQVVNALVKAGKDFDLLIVPGAGHGVGESAYAARRRKDFFVRHLLNVSPPDRNRLAVDGKN